MTMMARIENDAVSEERELDLAAVPAHKAAIWRPIEGDRPTVDRNIYDVTGPVYQIEPDRVLRVWTVTARDLAAVKADAKRHTSNAAEQARAKYITPGSGKAMSYQQVAAEAIRYGATNGAGSYPFLAARVSSGRYPNLATAAAATQQIEVQWAAVGSAIDAAEDRAKLAIDAATTVDQVQAATVVTWP